MRHTIKTNVRYHTRRTKSEEMESYMLCGWHTVKVARTINIVSGLTIVAVSAL